MASLVSTSGEARQVWESTFHGSFAPFALMAYGSAPDHSEGLVGATQLRF